MPSKLFSYESGAGSRLSRRIEYLKRPWTGRVSQSDNLIMEKIIMLSATQASSKLMRRDFT